MLTEIQLEQAIAAFVTFFVLIDAPGVAPIFASLIAPGGSAYARKMAMKSAKRRIMIQSLLGRRT